MKTQKTDAARVWTLTIAIAWVVHRTGFRVLFPKGMDANEYALKVQPAEKSLARLARRGFSRAVILKAWRNDQS